MSLCLSQPRPRRQSRKATAADVTLAEMIEAARRAITQRGELVELDLEQAGFTKAEISEHREAVNAQVRRDARKRMSS